MVPGASQLTLWQVRLRSVRFGSTALNQTVPFIYWKLQFSRQIIRVGDGSVENDCRNVLKQANKVS